MLVIYSDCDHCNASEERVFRDSWTGLDLCGMCLYKIIGRITMSPSSEGDNLIGLLQTI